jgi:biotin carboxyl carrier protein
VSTAGGRTMTVVANDRPYVVEVGDLTARPISVYVNGRPYRVYVEPRPVPESPAPCPAASVPVTTSASPGLPAEGAPVVAQALGPVAREVRAPMPGSIVSLHVRQGDEVAVGQQLCTLEAMKMKNAIRSSRKGVIGRVEVGEGQTVAYGDVLFTFE